MPDVPNTCMVWKLKILGTLVMLTGDVWAIVGWVFGISIGEYSFGIPEYAALITFFTGGIVAINIVFLRSLRKKERFYNLHPKILEVIEGYDFHKEGEKTPDALYAKGAALAEELRRLKIPFPNPPRNRQRSWWAWLPHLYGFSFTKNLERARERGQEAMEREERLKKEREERLKKKSKEGADG